MTHLFRVWSTQSNGLNTPTLFAPAAATIWIPPTDYTPPQPLPNEGPQLRQALLWKKHNPANPFVFFTPSLLFALQTAIYKRAAGEAGVFITCFDAGDARTPNGKRVEFRNAAAMLRGCGAEIRNRSDGAVRDYSDVVVATECVVLGGDARVVTLEALETAGLYQLYPALHEANDRREVRFNFVLKDLRKYLFLTERPLTEDRVFIAARLAAAWTKVSNHGDSAIDEEMTQTHLMASILALQQNADDKVLHQWLNRHSTILLDDDDDSSCSASVQTASHGEHPEVQEALRLQGMMSSCSIHKSALLTNAKIPWSTMDEERGSFRAWAREERDEYRASRPARRDCSESDRPHKKRKRETDDELAMNQYVARRADRGWLPREEYVARRDAFRASSGPFKRRRHDQYRERRW